MTRSLFVLILAAVAVFALPGAGNAAAPAAAPLVDELAFGDAAGEQQHGLTTERSDVIRGGLDQSARRLLTPEKENWEGGRMAFTLKVDPDKPNYVTVRLWGGDVSNDRLILFCEGKQIGYRHLGEVDILDQGCDEPCYNGRFVYNTSPLPVALTCAKTQLRFEIRSTGPIWGYGTKFAQYQQRMKDPTRGVYRIYVHTDGCFVPPPEESQGEAPANPPVRKEPGPEMLDQVKARIGREVDGMLRDRRPPGQVAMQLLSRAHHVKWTSAYQNPKAVEQVVKGLDALFARFRKDPKSVQSDPGVYNSDWFGLGLAGDSIQLLAKPLAATLDVEIDDGKGGKVKRREAWSEMLQVTRDWLRQHRRLYTNQTMIVDMNIYRENRALAVVDPTHALPEKDALRYLYEAVGLQPWLGSDTPQGSEKPMGTDYLQLTAKGLTKELGFVGYYGEVLDWMTQIYDATRSEPGQPGDVKIRAQLEKAARARAIFRYPMLDAEGNRAMRAETVVGWRDVHFPGDVTYGERDTWDASALYTAAATLDADSVGYSQQMFADNQFFASIRGSLKQSGLRTSGGLLGIPDQFESLQAQPPSAHRLPMTPGQPDFAWADEEDGVIAIKHGDEVLYASLYWRARHAVNFLARVHLLTPRFSRVAVVREDTEFEPSGMIYKRPDWTNWGFANGGPRYPGEMHSAHAGEELPIAKIPAGIKFKAGQESAFAGKGSFYTLRYGDYLIGMNCDKEKTFELKPPAGVDKAPDLVSGKVLPLNVPLKIGPRSTVVLYLGNAAHASVSAGKTPVNGIKADDLSRLSQSVRPVTAPSPLLSATVGTL